MKTTKPRISIVMGRIFFFAIAIVPFFLLQSCTSDDDSEDMIKAEYYFRFKLNGDQVTYAFTPESQVNLTGSYSYDETTQAHLVNVAGSKNIFESSTNTVTILIGSKEEILTGIEYSNIAGPDVTVSDFIFLMGYYNEEGQIFTAGLNVVPLWEDAYVQFESINENLIKGTFSGRLLAYDSSSGVNVLKGEVEISEGEFNVPRY